MGGSDKYGNDVVVASAKVQRIIDKVKFSLETEPFSAKSLIINLVWKHNLQLDSNTTDRLIV